MKLPLMVTVAALLIWPRLAPAAGPAFTDRRPNVLFIVADDLNTRIGCYGEPLVRTPALDSLARRGVRFERAYCQFPLCNPSRVSLLLGRYPTSTETVDFAWPALLGRNWVTLPEHFRKSGYQVRLLGKVYHFDKDLMDHWFAEEPPGEDYPPDWSAGRKWVRKSQQVHAQMLADLARYEPYRTLAPPSTNFANMLRTWANVFGPAPDEEEAGAEAKAKAYEWTADVKNAKAAVAQLERWAGSDKPFFLGVGFYKPHVPLRAPKRFFDLYDPDKIPLPADFAPTPTLDAAVPIYAARQNLDLFFEERVTPRRAREAIAAYYACASFMDEQLGRVLEALDRLGLRDNTILCPGATMAGTWARKGCGPKGRSLSRRPTRRSSSLTRAARPPARLAPALWNSSMSIPRWSNCVERKCRRGWRARASSPCWTIRRPSGTGLPSPWWRARIGWGARSGPSDGVTPSGTRDAGARNCMTCGPIPTNSRTSPRTPRRPA